MKKTGCKKHGHNMDAEQKDFSRFTDIRTVDFRNLEDINEIEIDITMDKAERMRKFIRDIKDPCLFRCGSAVVSVSFSDQGSAFQELLQDYLRSLPPDSEEDK